MRSRLTYANVIATLALFIALGGSSYAALRVTGKDVPRDALTGADIKNLTGRDVRDNSLTGADVKSLRAVDFAPGQLPAGATGPQGPKGDTGAQGVKGDTGARGPSNAFVNGFSGNVPAGGGGSVDLHTRTLDPGSYVFIANLRAVSGGSAFAHCQLIANNFAHDSKTFTLAPPDDLTTVTLVAAAQFNGPVAVRLNCLTNSGAGYSVTDGQFVALQVAELH